MTSTTFKYVVTNRGAIIFPELINHKDAVIPSSHMKIMSAGFCKITFKCNSLPEVSCYGESVSLNVKSIPHHDNIMVKRAFDPTSKYEFFSVETFYNG